jgi:sodium transport system ATP-binding protein
MITVDGLTKSFNSTDRKKVDSVDHVSFECHSGEVFGIIGPNGAGKTTLLRMLSTILEPTSGHATVAGYDICEFPDAVRQNIGFVSPSHGLYDRMTVRQNLRYFGLLNGISKNEIDEIIDEVIRWLGIQEYANTICKKLSTGIRQRVSIARAIVHQPPVIFFDEPTNGLDDASTAAILKFIRDCRKEGQAVIFSTHIMSQVEAICDRIAVMVRGRIVAVGTLDELRESTGETGIEDVYKSITRKSEAERFKI